MNAPIVKRSFSIQNQYAEKSVNVYLNYCEIIKFNCHFI